MQQEANEIIAQLSDELRKLRRRNSELEGLLANRAETEENLHSVSETALDAIIIMGLPGLLYRNLVV